jgi:hypothetical protein
MVPFIWAGVRSRIREDGVCEFHGLLYDREYVLRAMGLNVGQLAEGICGSPLVHNDYNPCEESDGAVLGSFSWSDQRLIENLFVGVL